MSACPEMPVGNPSSSRCVHLLLPAAEGALFENDHRQSFRRSINRGCEPRGARADNGHVIGPVWQIGSGHAEHSREFTLAGIFEHRAVGAHR